MRTQPLFSNVAVWLARACSMLLVEVHWPCVCANEVAGSTKTKRAMEGKVARRAQVGAHKNRTVYFRLWAELILRSPIS